MEENNLWNQFGNASIEGVHDEMNVQLVNAQIEQRNYDMKIFVQIMLEEKLKEERIRYQLCEKWDLRPSEADLVISDAKYQINLQKRLNSNSR